jgi:hypothetical protein
MFRKNQCFKSWSRGLLGTLQESLVISRALFHLSCYRKKQEKCTFVHLVQSAAVDTLVATRTSVLRTFTVQTFRHSMHYDAVILLQITAIKCATRQGYGVLFRNQITVHVLPTQCCGRDIYTTWSCFLFQLLWQFQRLLFSSATGKG